MASVVPSGLHGAGRDGSPVMSTVGASMTGIGPSRVTAISPVAPSTAGSAAPLPRERYTRTARPEAIVDDTDLGTRPTRTHGQHATAQQHRTDAHGVPLASCRDIQTRRCRPPREAAAGTEALYGLVVESVNVSVLL